MFVNSPNIDAPSDWFLRTPFDLRQAASGRSSPTALGP